MEILRISRLVSLAVIVAFINVTAAQEPQLTIMPSSVLENLGSNVLLSCSASVPNDQLITNMEWRGPGNRTIHSDGEFIQTLPGLDGFNQLDLMINNLKEKDVGKYECSANYAGNQRLIKSIDVNYYRDIDFEDTETVQTPILHSDAKIRCVVTAEPLPHVDWLKNKQSIKSDERIIQQSDGILIKRITEEDEGVYRCRARVQELGKIKFEDIQVEVHIPPQITGPPKNVSGVEKESVAFECIAKGKPAPVYTWVNRDSEVLNEKEGYFVDELTGELKIHDLRPDHAGTYRCLAENPAGEDFAEARLRVLTKPKVEQHLNITTSEGDRAEMQCILTGDPLPKAVFQKETNEAVFHDGDNEGGRIEVQQTIDDQGRRVGRLLISDVSRRDDGLYTCSGESSGGVTVSWGHITVEFTPTFEDQPQDDFWSWEQEKVNITCLATSIPNATVQWFLREEPIREEDPNLEVVARGPNGVLRVHPLDGSYFDTYTCKATNAHGVASHEVSLRQVQKPGPVASSQVLKRTATTVSWSLQEPMDNGGRPIQGYTVQFRLADSPWEEAQSMYWSRGSSYLVDHLTPLATYVFRFAARNDVGDGEWSGEKSVEMPKRSAPEEPLIFNVDPDKPKSIPYNDHYDLQWQVPLDNGEKIESYKIIYYKVSKKTGVWEPSGEQKEVSVPSPGGTTYKLEGLQSDSYYRIELRASNKIGFSTPAEAVIKTAFAPRDDPVTSEGTNSGVIVAIIVFILLIILIIVDVVLYFLKGVGITAFVVKKTGVGISEKDKEAMIEEGKLGTSPTEEKPSKDIVTEVKEKEVNETTPMMEGADDKEAIKKEKSQEDITQDTKENAAAVNEGLTKDSSV